MIAVRGKTFCCFRSPAIFDWEPGARFCVGFDDAYRERLRRKGYGNGRGGACQNSLPHTDRRSTS